MVEGQGGLQAADSASEAPLPQGQTFRPRSLSRPWPPRASLASASHLVLATSLETKDEASRTRLLLPEFPAVLGRSHLGADGQAWARARGKTRVPGCGQPTRADWPHARPPPVDTRVHVVPPCEHPLPRARRVCPRPRLYRGSSFCLPRAQFPASAVINRAPRLSEMSRSR